MIFEVIQCGYSMKYTEVREQKLERKSRVRAEDVDIDC
jgi:hypothetical protein